MRFSIYSNLITAMAPGAPCRNVRSSCEGLLCLGNYRHTHQWSSKRRKLPRWSVKKRSFPISEAIALYSWALETARIWILSCCPAISVERTDSDRFVVRSRSLASGNELAGKGMGEERRSLRLGEGRGEGTRELLELTPKQEWVKFASMSAMSSPHKPKVSSRTKNLFLD